MLHELKLASTSCHHIPLVKGRKIKDSPAGTVTCEHIKKVHRGCVISQTTTVVSKPHVFLYTRSGAKKPRTNPVSFADDIHDLVLPFSVRGIHDDFSVDPFADQCLGHGRLNGYLP